MIGSLRGTLIDRSVKGDVLVEVGGVGYRVTVPTTTLAKLGDVGAAVFLHVHTHVREDALVLYGFGSRDERACFEAVLSAHGVGPTLALSILSSHTPHSLKTAVALDDADALTLVPGVGKKTAARLLIELKSKLDLVELDGIGSTNGAVASGGRRAVKLDARADVREALSNLGYGPEEIRAVLRELPTDGDASALLKQALSLLTAARS